MGMVMIRCPRTGRDLATGIQSDREQFACTPVFFAETYCPICDSQHRWFARDAWVSDERGGLATAA
jgi:hypothetical protein